MRFPVVNVATHGLPALVLGVVTGRRHETATYELDRSQFDDPISSPYDQALRDQIAAAERAELYR